MKNNKIKPIIGLEINGIYYDYKLFESLIVLSKTKSIRRTSKEIGVSHSVLDRRIKKAEKKLGFKLVSNNYGSGSTLTPKGKEIIESYKQYRIRLTQSKKINISGGHIVSGLFESIKDNIPFDINVYSSDDASAFELGKKNLIDILALDDPLIGFENDLEFTAIAYDYLTLISSSENKEINDINELNGLNFINVKGSAQRLAWNTLKELGIDYNIVKNVNSQFDAFKLVKNNSNLHTFLNASYFNGNDILKLETEHIISLIQVNEDKNETKQLIQYLLNEGQELIKNEGFKPIKPWKIK